MSTQPQTDLARIIESARRLGIEMDEADALQWLTAMAATQSGGDIVMDTRSGVFGKFPCSILARSNSNTIAPLVAW